MREPMGRYVFSSDYKKGDRTHESKNTYTTGIVCFDI